MARNCPSDVEVGNLGTINADSDEYIQILKWFVSYFLVLGLIERVSMIYVYFYTPEELVIEKKLSKQYQAEILNSRRAATVRCHFISKSYRIEIGSDILTSERKSDEFWKKFTSRTSMRENISLEVIMWVFQSACPSDAKLIDSSGCQNTLQMRTIEDVTM
uniref:Uncharacterized protein n=1 Tax=Glossina austeni TaxID=7395 RepID=A0A1A9ULM2_GLOAU